MIKSIAVAGFVLAVATSAQAVTPAPIDHPDSSITHVAAACGLVITPINGVCVARTAVRHARRRARWNGSVCAHYY